MRLGAKEQASAIAEWLKDKNSAVRSAAIKALGRLRAKEQAPAIAELLKDEDSDVRWVGRGVGEAWGEGASTCDC